MDYANKIRMISNSFYNMGLERANIRDLTGAAEYLKKSLHLNKYQTDARNLLGLIYYEMGEISEALVQWVISTNLQPDNNRADYYLDEIQRKPGTLEVVSQNIKKYNQALLHAQSGSDDLAVLQLTRVVESNPNFVKAHLLLATLYICHEDFTKAGKSLYTVLKIDKNNPKAQWYMSIVKTKTGKAEIEKRKLKNAFSHRQMQDDDVIIPPSYKENTGWQSILNIGAGLLLGAMVIFFLVMPANTSAIRNENNQSMKQFYEQLNQKNSEIDKLTSQAEEYQRQKEVAENQLNDVVNNSDSIYSQYNTLIGILQAYRADNFNEAVNLYVTLDQSVITDENILAVVASVKADMETRGVQVMQETGDTMWSAGRKSEALDYYQKCLSINPSNPQVIFNMAMIYKSQENVEKANELFGQIIADFPDSELAAKASEQRGF